MDDPITLSVRQVRESLTYFECLPMLPHRIKWLRVRPESLVSIVKRKKVDLMILFVLYWVLFVSTTSLITVEKERLSREGHFLSDPHNWDRLFHLRYTRVIWNGLLPHHSLLNLPKTGLIDLDLPGEVLIQSYVNAISRGEGDKVKCLRPKCPYRKTL